MEQIHISRIRSGSHNLLIETGRYDNTARDARICKCGNNIQTLRHVLLECDIINVAKTNSNLDNSFSTVAEFFEWTEFHD